MNLLHHSKFFASYQCDVQRIFVIDFGQKPIRLTFCQLLAIRNKVNNIDITAHFTPEGNVNGIEILTLCNREHILILDTHQIIDLKELIQATFVYLELNSLVEAIL